MGAASNVDLMQPQLGGDANFPSLGNVATRARPNRQWGQHVQRVEIEAESFPALRGKENAMKRNAENVKNSYPSCRRDEILPTKSAFTAPSRAVPEEAVNVPTSWED